MSRSHRNAPRNALQNGRHTVRIIGGRWRGRKLPFAAVDELRPTPDRVRETLFNWLAPAIAGARCLDLFAGSGALGLEALSRGAAETVFVERDPAAARQLQSVLAELAPGEGRVDRAEALAWLAACPSRFDVVFLDPPFAAGLLPDVLTRLVAGGWLAPEARVYVECPAAAGTPDWPAGLSAHRSGRAGEVGYHLAVVTGGGEP